MPPTPRDMLPPILDAVRDSGRMIAAEFARPDGPRFSDHITAPLDHEIEMLLRERLLALLEARFVGEEAGVVEAPANGYCWVVDPHDGTRAFLEGRRGSAVSVALLRHGTPVLAVVHAPTSPDRGADLISWCMGEPIRRDGVPVSIDLSRRELAAGDVVFLNHGAWQRPVWQGTACAPAGFMPLPSIAYRLARVAVGDGIATQTLRPVNALDIAAGHALLLAAGGVLVAEDGVPVTYNELGESRPSACFGGAPLAVETLRGRAWRGSTEPRREPRVTLAWPRQVAEAVLDRAAGCLLGLAIGDDLGPSLELALVVARALVGRAHYDRGAVDAAVRAWIDADGRIGAAAPWSRAIAIGIWAGDPAHAAAAARADTPDMPGNEAVAALVAARIAGATEATLGRRSGTLSPLGEAAIGAGSPLSGTHGDPALLAACDGATRGRRAFPVEQVLRVLTWRPDAGLGVSRPRPETCWTDDLIDLAEALICLRRRTTLGA